MYLGAWAIDDLLTFVCNTQVFATGVATDADAVPSYRVYEDETTTPILTGNMALLDGGNTAGFYSEQITLSAANGFEKGKSYSIYIAATVSTIAGAAHRTFQIQAAVDVKSWAGGAIPAPSVTGIPTVDLKYILGTILTESAGQIAAAFVKFFNKATPTGTINSIPDAVAGAVNGLALVGSNLAPTVQQVVDGVWDETLASHLDAGSTGAALNTSSTATVFPSGAVEYTYTVTNADDTLPIDGVQVYFSTDLAGTNVVWSGITDAFGVARDVNLNKPFLNSGSYFVFRQLAGWIFSPNPDTEVVSP